MATVEVRNGDLVVDGTIVSFSNPVAEVLEFGDCIVIRLKLTGDDFRDIHQNVIAVDSDGSIRWKIEKALEEGYYDSYSAVHNVDGELWVYNLSGMSYKVDLDDGSILEGKFTK